MSSNRRNEAALSFRQRTEYFCKADSRAVKEHACLGGYVVVGTFSSKA